MNFKRLVSYIIGFMFLWVVIGYAVEKGETTKPPLKEVTEKKTSTEQKPEEGPPKTIVIVNGAKIDELDVLGMVNTITPGTVVHGSMSERKQKGIRKQALDKLVLDMLMSQEGKKQKVDVKKKDVDKEISDLRKRLKTSLETTLKKSKLTMKELRAVIEKDLYRDRLNEKINKEIKAKVDTMLTDVYIEEYYNKNKDIYKEPERISIREILIKADPGGGQKAWDEARVKTEEILKQIKTGKDFAETAKEFSQDTYAEKGGDMGFMHAGSLIPELESQASRLQIGELAGPIWSIYGYHIIKLEEKAAGIQRTFEESKERIKPELVESELKKMKTEWIEDLKKNAKIEYLEEEDKKAMEESKKNDFRFFQEKAKEIEEKAKKIENK